MYRCFEILSNLQNFHCYCKTQWLNGLRNCECHGHKEWILIVIECKKIPVAGGFDMLFGSDVIITFYDYHCWVCYGDE